MRKTARLRQASVNDAGQVVGEDHHRAKLSDHDVWLICELRADGMSIADLARKFDVCKATISYYTNGKRRAHMVVGQKGLAKPRTYRFTPADPDEFGLVHIPRRRR